MFRFKLSPGVNQKHHTVVGKDCDTEEHQGTHEPSGFLEGVRKSENSSTNYGDENVGKGLGLRRKLAGAEQGGVFPGKRWYLENMGG